MAKEVPGIGLISAGYGGTGQVKCRMPLQSFIMFEKENVDFLRQG